MSRSNAPRESYRLDDLPLPYVEGVEHGPAFQTKVGDKEVHIDTDDSVDVLVEQTDAGRPFAQLTFVPAGPVGGFTLLGFGPEELRRLGRFLIESADDLEQRFGHPVQEPT